MSVPRCSCGATAQVLGGFGEWRTVNDLDVHRLADLLSGDLDYARCDAGCQLSARATIVFTDRELGQILVVPGELVDSATIVANLPDGDSDRFIVVEDAGELRRIVTDLLSDRMRVFWSTDIGGPDGLGDVHYLNATWRRLTASVFAAVGVALTGRISALRLNIVIISAADNQSDPVESFFTSRHWVVWESLLTHWANEAAGGSFEDDLRDFVDLPPLLGNAAQKFAAGLELTDLSDGSAGATEAYRREALRASLYLRLNLPNPHADRWGFLWLWWEVGQRWHGEGGTHRMPGLALSADRVRATIPPDSARFAGAELINQALGPSPETAIPAGQLLELVLQVLHEFGYDEQGASVIRGVRLTVPIDHLADEIVTFLQQPVGSRAAAVQLAKAFAGALVEAERIDDLRRVADAMRPGDSPDESIGITLWFCSQLISMSKPKMLLDEIGIGRTSESSLPIPARAWLLLFRMHALRQLGRWTDARALLDIAPRRVVEHSSNRQHLAVERARLLCDMGSPAEALTVLETLLQETEQPDPPLYETLAATLIRFGRYREAADYATAAYTLALRDRMKWPVQRYAAHAMWCQALGGRQPDADLFDVVREIDPYAESETALQAAWAVLVCGSADTDSARRVFVDSVVGQAVSIADRAGRDGRVQVTYHALYVAALYDQSYRTERALESWRRVVAVMADHHHAVAADCDLYLAANLVLTGDWAAAREFLRRALESTTIPLGDDSPIGLAAAARHNAPEIAAVTAAVLADPLATPADVRLVGEQRRGLASRRLHLRATAKSPAWQRHGLDDEVVAAVAPNRGQVGVLEWVTDGVETRALLTVISSRGSVTGTVVPMPEVDLVRLARRLVYRLSNWRAGRPGDPFDSVEWRTCQAWLHRLIDDHLAATDHLVIIPLASCHRIPWHVAALDRLTCSYAPSWVALLDTTTGGPWPDRWREGVVAVPRVGDPREVTDAMRQYLADVEADVTTEGQLRVLDGVDADHAAVKALLEGVDIATLLAHGYVSSVENEVALMLAADGALPLAHSVAAHSAYGRRHRFGWLECAELSRAPHVMLSAACGTGTSHVVGLGEHLGFYNLLHPVGLRAFVGPQWDIIAGDVLPILCEIRTSFLSNGMSLGQSLRIAIRHARDRGTPPWSAYALILEGDWR